MKALRLIYVGLFCLCLVLPAILLDHVSTVSTAEKRSLAPPPSILNEKGRRNHYFFKEVDAYIKDRFGFRDQFIAAQSWIMIHVFKGAVGGERVLRGKEDWLFFIDQKDGDNFKDYLKLNLPSESEVLNFRHAVESRALWCKQHGIEFLLVVGPNKHSVYADRYPIERPSGPTRADILLGAVSERVPVVFPRDELILRRAEGEELLYLEADTHWNQAGAYIAFLQIQHRIKELFPQYSFPMLQYRREWKEVRDGDLTEIIGHALRPQSVVELISVDGKAGFTFIKDEGRHGVLTRSFRHDLPRAVVFRDSFTIALVPFLSTQFSYADYRWKMMSREDREFVLAARPDIVILEVVERHLNSISVVPWE